MKGLFILLGLVALTQCAPAPSALADPILSCEDIFGQETCDGLRDIMTKFGEKADVLTAAIKAMTDKHLANIQEKLEFIRQFLVDKATNVSCDKFLPQATCDQLDKLLALIKVSVDDVNRAVREAIAHGATTAADIVQKAKDYARDVLSKATCVDLLGADGCQKLKDFAAKFHLNVKEVLKAVREAILEHATTVQDIFNKAKDFLTGELTCEQILGAKTCAALEKAAQTLGERVTIINKALQEAVKNGLTKVPEILNYIQEYMVNMVTDFKCTNVLSQDLCDKIMAIGGHFKDGVATINKAIEEAIVHGAAGMQEIYNVAIAWLRDHVTAKTCEELIDPNICQKIKDFAKKVHVSVTDVMTAVKEAIAEGAWGPDLVKKAIDYLKAKISCEAVIGKATCDRIRALADKFGIALDKVDEIMREAIARGVTKVSELYKTVVKWIMDQWTDLIGDEEMKYIEGEQNDFLDIKGRLQKALMEAVEKILAELQGVNEVVRQKIKDLIVRGKVSIFALRKKIMDLIAEFGTSQDEQLLDQIDDLREQLKLALAKAKGFVKLTIKSLLALSKDKLAQAKALIKKILGDFGMAQDSFIDILLDETHEQIMQDMEEEITAFSGMVMEDMINHSETL